MERKGILQMMVLSIRTNAREIAGVLEELNRGAREQTYPRTLERCFRTMEHDARTAGLSKFADAIAHAKEASALVLDRSKGSDLVELLSEANGEFVRAADDVEAGRPHKLDEQVRARLEQAVGSLTERE